MPRVLITYATRYGSTRDVADVIGEELTAAGLDADALPVAPLIQVGRYDAAIIGSPSYGGRWLPGPSLFVAGNAAHLASIPVALFTTGMLGVKNPKLALKEHDYIIKALQEISPGLEPVSTALFHGSFDRANLSFFFRLLDRMAGTPHGDHRNWEAVRGWAQRVTERFKERWEVPGD